MHRLDSGGGHIVTALLVFLVGVALVVGGFDMGREIVAGALGSLWTVLRFKNVDGQVATSVLTGVAGESQTKVTTTTS